MGKWHRARGGWLVVSLPPCGSRQRCWVYPIIDYLKTPPSREVEDAVLTHPAVSECAVVGLPDPRWVEAVTGPPPGSGGVRSERHATASMGIPSMLARASAGVR